MSPRLAVAVTIAAWTVAATACGDGGDDDCPDCWQSVGGSITFPPGVPTVGNPEPMGGSTATGGLGTGGLAGNTGGLGGVITGGLGGTDTGGFGTGGVSANGGVSGTGAFGNQGGDLTGGVFTGGFGGTL
jgi:hypothetical protein